MASCIIGLWELHGAQRLCVDVIGEAFVIFESSQWMMPPGRTIVAFGCTSSFQKGTKQLAQFVFDDLAVWNLIPHLPFLLERPTSATNNMKEQPMPSAAVSRTQVRSCLLVDKPGGWQRKVQSPPVMGL